MCYLANTCTSLTYLKWCVTCESNLEKRTGKIAQTHMTLRLLSVGVVVGEALMRT